MEHMMFFFINYCHVTTTGYMQEEDKQQTLSCVILTVRTQPIKQLIWLALKLLTHSKLKLHGIYYI